jgi:hypothetical protein
MSIRTKTPFPPLAKGQLWKTSQGFIEIVEAKRLIHYRLLKQPGQKLVRTQMSSWGDLDKYLREHRAELVS